MVSALVHGWSGPGLVQALVRDTVLCSWARHLTLTVSLSTLEYKWLPANCWGNLTSCRGVTCDGLASRPGGVEILLAASCYRNRDKLRQLSRSQSGSKASLINFRSSIRVSAFVIAVSFRVVISLVPSYPQRLIIHRSGVSWIEILLDARYPFV